MDAIIEEIALRSWTIAAGRMAEIQKMDDELKEGESIEKEEKILLDFLSRWMAGSLFIDLFSEGSIRTTMDQVFLTPAIQVFVFDLKFHAMVGIPEAALQKVRQDIAYHLAPGFENPRPDDFGKLVGIKKVLSEFEFTDLKWRITKDEIAAVLGYMPWLIPLLLISLGGTIASGTYQDTAVAE